MGARKKYSKEFKEEAVKLTRVEGVSITQVGEELGINPNILSRWRRQYQGLGEKAFVGQGKARDEEMAALKRELNRVKKERDFLREPATFFAKESK